MSDSVDVNQLADKIPDPPKVERSADDGAPSAKPTGQAQPEPAPEPEPAPDPPAPKRAGGSGGSRSRTRGGAGAGGGGGGSSRRAAGIPSKSPFAKLLPGAERVEIRHRNEEGKLTPVGDYTSEDLESAGGTRQFLLRYAKPRFGPGEYHFTYIDSKGERHDAGYEIIPEERATNANKSLVDELREVINAGETLDARAERKAREWMDKQQQQNPLSGLKDNLDVLERLGGGGNQMMPLMMMMMMNGGLGGQQSAPSTDPSVARMIEKVAERIDQLERQSMQPQSAAPPPPPPPEQPRESLTDAIKAMAEILKPALGANQQAPQQDPYDVALKLNQLTATKSDQQLTYKDLLEFHREMRKEVETSEQSNPTDPLRKSLQDLSLLREAMASFGGGGSESGNIVELIDKFIDRFPDNAKAFQKVVHSVREKEQKGAGRSKAADDDDEDDDEKLPPEFKQYASAIEAAEKDSERLEATFNSLEFLKDSGTQFQRIPLTILKHAQDGNIEQAFEVLRGYLNGLAELGHISAQCAKDTIEAFVRHRREVLQALGAEDPDKGEPEGGAPDGEPEGGDSGGEGEGPGDGEPSNGAGDGHEQAAASRANGAS